MNYLKNILIILFLGLSLFVKANTIDIPQEIISGFTHGKAELISKYFNSNVELTIDNKENIFSSTQAEIILRDFFKKNPPVAFSIIHEGGKSDSKYAIGSLKTSQGNYRITILLKQSSSKTYIHQLRIEKDAV